MHTNMQKTQWNPQIQNPKCFLNFSGYVPAVMITKRKYAVV